MPKASWLEASLTVDGELAEPVAEVLARFIPNGIVIESTAVTADSDDSEGHAVGLLRVFGYLPVDEQLVETKHRLEEALWYLGRIRPLPKTQFRSIPQTDWSEAWKKNYRPITIGSKLVIVPAWMEMPSTTRVPIKIDPGMAFGTGTHPTTQLCLEILEAQFRKNPEAIRDWDVIDIGCGTAILAIAALKLGARRALGVDIDEDAIKAAAENARTNGVLDRLELGLGSLSEIRAGAFSYQQSNIVFANILAPVIIHLLDEGLSHLLASPGNLVISGILDEQVAEVDDAAREHNLCVVERRQIGDWVALNYQLYDGSDTGNE